MNERRGENMSIDNEILLAMFRNQKVSEEDANRLAYDLAGAVLGIKLGESWDPKKDIPRDSTSLMAEYNLRMLQDYLGIPEDTKKLEME